MQKFNVADFMGVLKNSQSKARRTVAGAAQQSFLAAASKVLQNQTAARKAAAQSTSLSVGRSLDLISQALQPQLRNVSRPADDLISGSAAMPGAADGVAKKMFMSYVDSHQFIDNIKAHKWYSDRDVDWGGIGEWKKSLLYTPAILTAHYRAAKDENAAMGRSNAEIDKRFHEAMKAFNEFAADLAAGKDFGEPDAVKGMRSRHAFKGDPRAYDPTWIPPEVFQIAHYTPEGVVFKDREKT
jgi:hypothetical protein